jgi:hypothetical protein
VARHLVAAGRLVDDDPAAALEQARAARAIGARLGVVREAVGIAAYRAGEWAEALAELRAARRISGGSAYLPIMADCERALGRPERALALARSAEAAGLPAELRVELRIVEAGARRDLSQLDAALVVLQGPDLDRGVVRPWSARLWYAYADTLRALGRTDEARDWFLAAAAADTTGATDAAEQLLELDGVTVLAESDEGELLEEDVLVGDRAPDGAGSEDITVPGQPDEAELAEEDTLVGDRAPDGAGSDDITVPGQPVDREFVEAEAPMGDRVHGGFEPADVAGPGARGDRAYGEAEPAEAPTDPAPSSAAPAEDAGDASDAGPADGGTAREVGPPD